MAELPGHRAGCARGDSPVPGEEKHSWAQLLGSRPSPGHWSSSSSICTEDFAAKFWEGMVEPLLCQQEPAGHVPMEGAHPGQDESLFPTGRSLDTGTQLAMELDRRPWQDRQDRQDRQFRSPSRSRRESLESLGARISRLSQSHVGVSWGVPWASPSAQPALGYRDSHHGDLVVTALPEHSWRTPGISAGRSRAGTSTGSSFPRATHARTKGHPALDMRQQEPPALWRRGRNVTFPMDDTDRTQAADSSRSTGTAMRAPGQWGSPVTPGLRGDQKEGLLCKGVPPRWRSQPGTRELGSAAKSWSQRDRARTGLALLGHAWDTHHWCHKDLQSTSWQGACVGQERLDKERRRTATSLKQKLELLERLRELERGSRSLLQQRLRVMQQLRGLLQRDEAETLRQLQEALEQDGAGRSARREHLPIRPRDPAGPGRAGGSPAVGTPPWGHGPRPSSALGPGPSPATLGWVPGAARGGQGVPLVPLLPSCAPQLIPALPQPRSPRPARAPAANPAAPRAVAEGAGSPGSRWTEGGGDWGIGREDMETVTASALEEPALPIPGASSLVQGGECQPRSAPVRGQSARVTGTSRVSVPMQDGEQRQQTEKTPAPGAPREPLSQGQREHPHPSPSLSSMPGLCQRARGSLGLLHHLQELQLDKTQNSGTPTALGGQLGTRGREEGQGQPGVGTPPLPQPWR